MHTVSPPAQPSYISEPPQGATVRQIVQNMGSATLETDISHPLEVSTIGVDRTSPQIPSGINENLAALDIEIVLDIFFSQSSNGRRLGFLMKLSQSVDLEKFCGEKGFVLGLMHLKRGGKGEELALLYYLKDMAPIAYEFYTSQQLRESYQVLFSQGCDFNFVAGQRHEFTPDEDRKFFSEIEDPGVRCFFEDLVKRPL